MSKFSINSDVKHVLSMLTEQGFEAYIVGGSVRDMLIGKEPTDYDITTNATPSEMKAVFASLRVIETGIKHGTLTVVYNGNPYEITTYRVDVGYSDNRHPDGVTFTASLPEDLARRDFTVNAMCLDKDGNLVDIFGGVDDIKRGVIRAVGDPTLRFKEDSLRILRALRFASTLGFSLDEATAAAAREKRALLTNISRERVYTEITKLISGVGAYDIITEYRDIIKEALPSINAELPTRDAFLSLSPAERLIALYNGTEAFSADMAALRSDSAIRKLGTAVLENITAKLTSPRDMLYLLERIGEASARSLAKIKSSREGVDYTALLEGALSSGVPYRISELKLGGTELGALGYKGAEIGETLQKLLFAVIDGEAKNEKDKLLEHLNKTKNNA